MKMKIALAIASVLVSAQVAAAVVPFNTGVQRTLISENYGECMFSPQ